MVKRLKASPSGIVAGHPTSLFLLPFNETGSTHLEGLDSDPQTQPEPQPKSIALPRFKKCILQRSSEEELQNADADARVNSAYILSPGQYVLLQPTENSIRPGIARIISFHVFQFNNKLTNKVRIKWFYRGEDLGDIIQNVSSIIIPGEDELFETDHYDYIDADTIAGRCLVLSYPEWLKKQLELSKLNQSNRDSPQLQHGGSEMDTERNDCDIDTAVMEDDDDSDTTSSFRDNYSDASLYLYCRRFYHIQTHVLLTSVFENKSANPLEELAKLRLEETAAINYGKDVDPTFTISGERNEDDAGSDSDEDAIISADERDTLQSRALNDDDDVYDPSAGGNRRKRSQSGRKHKRQATTGRRRGAGAIFALPSYLGENLMCRDDQKDHVRNFLLGVIHDPCAKQGDSSRCLYISGVPGTGKTATVREVVRDLRVRRRKGELPPFQVLELNCMALPNPTAVYTELYAAVTGSRSVSAPHAAQLLEQRYMRNDLDDVVCGNGHEASNDEDGGETDDMLSNSGKKRKAKGGGRGKGRGKAKARGKQNTGNVSEKEGDGVIIVVLDEMDVLLARNQKVVYDLLEWPGRKNARIAMIGIANTMDLPERMLPRMGSRLGLNRLVYPPYNRDQLITILRQSHPPTQISDEALRLCASKVGGVSGDVRRALQLCRRAIELASDDLIMPRDMQRAIKETAGDFRLCALAQLALLERVTLACVVVLSRSLLSLSDDMGPGAVGGCTIDGVTERAWDVVVRFDSELQGFKPQHIDFEDACFRLANLRLVVIDKHLVRRLSRVILNVPVDDCTYALKDCCICKDVLSEP